MKDSKHKNADKPLIGISIGDYNGIGPEVTIKSLSDSRILNHFTPVIYADGRVISFYRKALDLQFNYHQCKGIDKIHFGKVNVINLNQNNIEINPGQESEDAGAYARLSLERAVSDLKNKHIHALVTAPLSKELIQTEDFNFPGHTEYLAQQAEAKDCLMFLVSEELRVGVVTGHIPLSKVPAAVTKEKISSKLDIMLKSLKKDFGIKKPRVAVLGLNPHAGENGLLGEEESKIISPLVQAYKENGHLVFGPFPADGFFGSSQFRSFDGILAMYHDQGLIPFKNIAFENGVNFTAGLSFIRTSPDHGTAFGIAGKNQADATSMQNALFTAFDIVQSRKEYS